MRLTHITHYYVCILYITLPLHPLLMSNTLFLHVYGLNTACFELTTYECMWFDMLWTDHQWMHVVCLWLFDWHCIISHKADFNMDLFFYDAHIIHYYIKLLQLVALDQIYFTHPYSLVIYSWIWATLLHWTSITPTGVPNVWKYVWLFEGLVIFRLNGTLC